jgi:hypothetical protein
MLASRLAKEEKEFTAYLNRLWLRAQNIHRLVFSTQVFLLLPAIDTCLYYRRKLQCGLLVG